MNEKVGSLPDDVDFSPRLGRPYSTHLSGPLGFVLKYI